jgi:hypothetical protein
MLERNEAGLGVQAIEEVLGLDRRRVRRGRRVRDSVAGEVDVQSGMGVAVLAVLYPHRIVLPTPQI